MTQQAFARSDNSVVSRWWWTVDRVTLTALLVLLLIGAWLTLSASPSVAGRIDVNGFHFIRRQFAYVPMAVLIILGVSLLRPIAVRRLAAVGFVAALLLMAAALFVGPEIKGATRWISLGFVSLQPSEFVKPTFAVVTAWMFAEHRMNPDFPGGRIAFGLFCLVAGLLLMQPDFGMTLVVGTVWATQLFVAGLPLVWVSVMALGGLALGAGAYALLPHVASRIDRFLDPASGDTYQVDKALEAIRHGGLFGTGPGEGTVKLNLPDAHTDFVFAVAGEEFGIFLGLLLVGLFALVVVRGMAKLLEEQNLFVVLAVSGILTQFGLQAVINIGSTLRLLPTKGMTLPFISYGGSSMMALALGMGMVLALTRKGASQGGLR